MVEISLIFDLISLIFVILAIIVAFNTGSKSYTQYKKYGSISTKLFLLAAYSLGLALLMLTIRVVITEVNEFLALNIFTNIAIIFSVIAVIFIDSFSFNMVFPDKYKLLTLVSIIFLGIASCFYVFDYKTLVNGEVTFTWDPFGIGIPITNLIQLCVIPLFTLIPSIVFFYYARKIKEESSIKSKKANVFGLGILILTISYTVEIIGLPSVVFIFRSLLFVGVYLIYVAMFKITE